MAVDTSVGAMDDGGQQLRDLQTKVLELEQALQSMSLGQNLAQREFDAIQGQLGDIAGEVDAQAVQFDPSTKHDGQTHDGRFVGDPANNNAQEIYAPGVQFQDQFFIGDGSMGPKGPKGDGSDPDEPTEPLQFQAPYDAYGFDDKETPTSFKIRGGVFNDGTAIPTSPFNFVGSFKWSSVAGVFTAVEEAVGPPAGDGSIDFDTALSFTASTNDLIYIYHQATDSGTTNTLEQYTLASSDHVFTDGGDISGEGRLYLPLWLVVYTDHITNLLDLRPIAMAMIHRMGN